jgi:signal transduction histidine kinase
MRLPAVKVLLVHRGAPEAWVAALEGPHQVRDTADADEALAIVGAGWPEVVLAVDLAQISSLKRRCAPGGVPVLAAVRPGDSIEAALERGADDVVCPTTTAEVRHRIALHRRLAAATRELRVQQRFSALAVLSAGLAHEVRNPINAIVNGLGLLSSALAGDRAAQVVLEAVSTSAWRIERLVKEIHEYDAGSRGAVSTWDPVESVQVALAILARRHDCGGVELQLEAPRRPVPGRPTLLDQVVMNLLDNALRAGPAGGLLQVRIRSLDRELQVEVEDQGPGVAPEDRDRIFQPFFTTRRGADGMGLGLHLCRRIVEEHHGELLVRSGGVGAVFELRLPLADDGLGDAHVTP